MTIYDFDAFTVRKISSLQLTQSCFCYCKVRFLVGLKLENLLFIIFFMFVLRWKKKKKKFAIEVMVSRVTGNGREDSNKWKSF